MYLYLLEKVNMIESGQDFISTKTFRTSVFCLFTIMLRINADE